MGFLRYFLILLLSVVALAEPPRIPTGWGAFLQLDRNSNVPTRAVLADALQETVPVFHVDIPIEKAETVESIHLDEATRKKVFIEKDGKQFVRFYFVQHPILKAEQKKLETLKKKGYEAVHSHWGALMQSHSTFFIWNEKDHAEEPMFLKSSWESKGEHYNTFSNAQVAIANNDRVEAVVADAADPFIRVFPERFGAQIKGEDMEFAYSLRSVRPSGAEAGPDSLLLPLHGLLGSESYLKAFASKNPTKTPTTEAWLQKEYLPKLARFTAETQLRHGLYFEAHSQNLLVYVNKKTGEIESFVARDMNDVMHDVHARLSQGRADHMGKEWASTINHYFIDQQAPEAKTSGWNMAVYLMQSVGDLWVRSPLYGTRNAEFLEHYLKEAERIVGAPIQLGKESADALTQLKAGRDADSVPLLEQLWHAKGKWRNGVEAGRFNLVAQEIYDQISKLRMPQLTPEMTGFDQKQLSKLFKKKWDADNRIVIHFEDAHKNILPWGVTYAFDGEKIHVFETKSGRNLGYVYDLTDEEKKQAGSLPAPKVSWCGWAWKKVRPALGLKPSAG